MDRVARQLNHTIGESEDAIIDLIKWETHAWPGFGEDAQDVINRQIEPGDIFIGILWRRIGTATKRSLSGTVEEFERAYELWEKTGHPSMMLYFNTAPRADTDLGDDDQHRIVENFKQMLEERGALYWEYCGADEFEECAFPHLYREILKQLAEPELATPVDRPDQGGWEETVRDQEARKVLKVLEESRTGQGYRTIGGLAQQTRLSAAKVKSALDSYPQLVLRSRLPDTKGAALFKFRR